MDQKIYAAHSHWWHLLLLIAIIAIGNLLLGLLSKRPWQKKRDQTLSMIFLMALDLQMLMGILLWLVRRRWSGATTLISWEHPATMLLAVVAAHYGAIKVKRGDSDAVKFRGGLLGFGIAIVLVLIGTTRMLVAKAG